MAPQRFRVLRCCSCRLFQAHQEKKSLKWTCKACGEKQSFLRAVCKWCGQEQWTCVAYLSSLLMECSIVLSDLTYTSSKTYGEGSGADCRRHVQKLNLLQGQISEMSLRSLEEPVNVDGEEVTGPQQAEHAGPQEKPQSSQSRWLKYLEGDSEELGTEGGECFRRQPLSRTEQLDPPFNTGLPRKRKRSQSTVPASHGPDVWSPSDSEVPSEPQKDRTGLMGKVQEESRHKDTRELSVPLGDPAGPAHVRTTSSKWERFLLPPSDSPCVDVGPPVPLHRDPRPAGVARAEQGALRAQTPREGCPSRPHDTPELPWPTHALTSGSQRPCMKTPEQPQDTGPLTKGGPLATGTQEPSFVRLCDLFKTGEDFEDDL